MRLPTSGLPAARAACRAGSDTAQQAGARGAKVSARLEIDADVADGVPGKTEMDVTGNARTLKFSDFGLEEE
jgi:hypothetical protein